MPRPSQPSIRFEDDPYKLMLIRHLLGKSGTSGVVLMHDLVIEEEAAAVQRLMEEQAGATPVRRGRVRSRRRPRTTPRGTR